MRQVDLAERIGVSKSTVRDWESGASSPTPEHHRQLEALGVKMEETVRLGDCMCGERAVVLVPSNQGDLPLCDPCWVKEQQQRMEAR